MKPKIAITGTAMDTKYGYGTFLNRAYSEAVIKAGGIPVLLPLTFQDLCDEWLDSVDGLLLSGGEDVDPNRFGQHPIPKQGKITPDRDVLELSIIPKAIEKKIPIFAICRGIQVLNIACGGTLYQDINSQIPGTIKHSQNAPRWFGTHYIDIADNSKLHKIVQTSSMKVNSYHHQSIHTLGDGLEIVAHSSDGVIEAVEGTENLYILGVQWHPEGMWERDSLQFELFTAFIRECQ
ncbi:hypothetical protein BHU72_07020 [Desulfuribacillus stibiiarsenatis]|uniref:Uncharacterized protein n=1 Tax=Desulfuribacillus stibiiarsenatis TaxID=1390249 RepID=A0A1E5L4C0_9FIRM|nr:gamma-glutamyl-gamma-aminobutyrate hydrolase family protein [Desulfuribacillus stibiiarsenatis]OEH84936.1 hypothetical protein BHU72_07020 [Desulfuribacillus stibiiarsenatis]